MKEKRKVEDYKDGYDDYEDDRIITEKRKKEIIEKVENKIKKNNIAMFEILEICDNYAEDKFVSDWLSEQGIRVSGINCNIDEHFDNTRRIKRLNAEQTPERLDNDRQIELFTELNNMRNSGIDTNSKKYQKIRGELIEHNMKLAKYVAYKRASYFDYLGVETEDIGQIAMIPLIYAVDHFDASRGYQFSTYAWRVIWTKIERELVNGSEKNKKATWKQIEKCKNWFFNEKGREPTIWEVSDLMGMSVNSVKQLEEDIKVLSPEKMGDLNSDEDIEFEIANFDDGDIPKYAGDHAILDGVYLDTHAYAYEHQPWQVLNQEEDGNIEDVEKVLLGDDLRKVLDTLTPKQRRVMELRYGLVGGRSHTLEEVRIGGWSY